MFLRTSVHGIAVLALFCCISSGSIAQQSCSTDPAAHRLILAPTSNALPGATIHAEASGMLVGNEADALNLGAAFQVNVFMFGNKVHAGAGISTYKSLDDRYPFTCSIQSEFYRTDHVLFSAGYWYYQQYIKTGGEHTLNPLHWFYTNTTWNPGRSSYILNLGVTARKNAGLSLSGTIGTNIYLSKHFKFITDFTMVAGDPNAYFWLWTGFRYYDKAFTFEVASILWAAVIVNAGITI